MPQPAADDWMPAAKKRERDEEEERNREENEEVLTAEEERNNIDWEAGSVWTGKICTSEVEHAGKDIATGTENSWCGSPAACIHTAWCMSVSCLRDSYV